MNSTKQQGRPHAGSILDALAELARAHAGLFAEEAAEVKLAGETQARGDFLDGQPFVAQQLPRLIQPHALEKIVDALLLKLLEHALQPRTARAGGVGQFGHAPVA